ncbi:MAG: hypothetical protein QOF00_821 [Pseudonocardiales bacterium]|nr:hypothetical protein [Pseudonocardiales bacterium]
MSEQQATEQLTGTDEVAAEAGPQEVRPGGAATDPEPAVTAETPAAAPAEEAVASAEQAETAEHAAAEEQPAQEAAGSPASESAPASPAPSPTAPTPPRPAPPRPAPPRPGPPPAAPAPPRPVAAPAAAAPAPAPEPSPVTAASTDPSRWGRVDAEGTIYVRTADGERVVGSWQAGEPEEGLAHFARRFDDILTEVELLFARLLAGGGDPKQALSSAKALRDSLPDATVVGDLAGLAARVDDLVAQAEQAVGAARSARDAQRAAAVARKEELAVEAETLATEATQWKQAGDRFTAILDEWRTIRGIDRKTDELLWKRFSKAREAFNRRRGSHFADLDRQRSSAKNRKEELAVEAEKLADSEDWGPTAARFRDLMTEWKAAGRAHKDADDTLWQRFRGAQDAFFARRSAVFAERDAEFAANAEAKKALLVEAEKIDLSDPSGARATLRSVQERWEEIGKVPRDDIRPLEARLRAVEEKVRDSADRQWRRTDPEAEARVAQFRERVAQFEAQAEKARSAGKTKRAEEADAQAAQWREWAETAEQAVQHR